MTNQPKRIQRRRTKGWRMPANTVYVGRPTGLGNPFVPIDKNNPGHVQASVDYFRGWVKSASNWSVKIGKGTRVGIHRIPHWSEPKTIREHLPKLKGVNLACWCRLGEPCHADVLLEIANG